MGLAVPPEPLVLPLGPMDKPVMERREDLAGPPRLRLLPLLLKNVR